MEVEVRVRVRVRVKVKSGSELLGDSNNVGRT